jgi:hypothetical protein
MGDGRPGAALLDSSRPSMFDSLTMARIGLHGANCWSPTAAQQPFSQRNPHSPGHCWASQQWHPASSKGRPSSRKPLSQRAVSVADKRHAASVPERAAAIRFCRPSPPATIRGMEPNPYEATKQTGGFLVRPRNRRIVLIAVAGLGFFIALPFLEALIVLYYDWKRKQHGRRTN